MTVEQFDEYMHRLMKARFDLRKDSKIYSVSITESGPVINVAMDDTSDMEFMYKNIDSETGRICGVMDVHGVRFVKYEEGETCEEQSV